MPREDLSGSLIEATLKEVGKLIAGVHSVRKLDASFGRLSSRFQTTEGERIKYGLYGLMASFYLENGAKTVSFERFEGDRENGIEPSIDGVIICNGGNKIYLQLVFLDDTMEVCACLQ